MDKTAHGNVNSVAKLVAMKNVNNRKFRGLKVRASHFINRLMHSIKTVVDVEICVVFKSLNKIKSLLQHVSDHIGFIIRE
jgi:hypothetical protein